MVGGGGKRAFFLFFSGQPSPLLEARLWKKGKREQKERVLGFFIVINKSVYALECLAKWERLKIARTQECLVPASRQPMENIVEKMFSLLCF